MRVASQAFCHVTFVTTGSRASSSIADPSAEYDNPLLQFLVFIMSILIQQDMSAANFNSTTNPSASSGKASNSATSATSQHHSEQQQEQQNIKPQPDEWNSTKGGCVSGALPVAVEVEAAAAYALQLDEVRRALRAARFRNTRLSWDLAETRRQYEAR